MRSNPFMKLLFLHDHLFYLALFGNNGNPKLGIFFYIVSNRFGLVVSVYKIGKYIKLIQTGSLGFKHLVYFLKRNLIIIHLLFIQQANTSFFISKQDIPWVIGKNGHLTVNSGGFTRILWIN